MITIINKTMKDPISYIGMVSGVCWNSDILDNEKNYKRGLECIKSDHGRTFEFPDVYLIIEGYSARVMREYMRHVGGGLTCLQESTRYVNCENFQYVMPFSLMKSHEIAIEYQKIMYSISQSYQKLIELGMPKEDAANILPLGMYTKLVDKKNLRSLADMSKKRLCNRAYWEYRCLMHDIMSALSSYSEEWRTCVELLFKPQCEVLGYCPEKIVAGRV